MKLRLVISFFYMSYDINVYKKSFFILYYKLKLWRRFLRSYETKVRFSFKIIQ